MKMKSNSKPLNEQEKQRQPLPGETSPEEAFRKARQFAAQEKAKLKSSK